MTRKERSEIKDWIFNVLEIFRHQDEFLADESGLDNFENPMFDKAESYILGIKKMKITVCASANCMNRGCFKNYLVRWFHGGEESKKIIPLCKKCASLWRKNGDIIE